MKSKNKITEEQRQFILLHLNDRPRSKFIKESGVTSSTFYRYARMYGGELDYTKSSRNLRYEEIVRKYYPTMSTGEIEGRFNIPHGRVAAISRRLGVTHTPETAERIRRKTLEAKSRGRTAETERRRTETWKRVRRLEEWRALSGIPQQTKFKIARYPEKTYKAIWHLETRYNYFRDEEVGGLFTLFYDGETRRTPMEHLYTKRYKLKFQEA